MAAVVLILFVALGAMGAGQPTCRIARFAEQYEALQKSGAPLSYWERVVLSLMHAGQPRRG